MNKEGPRWPMRTLPPLMRGEICRRTEFLSHVDTTTLPRRLRSQSRDSGDTSTVVSAYGATAGARVVTTSSEGKTSSLWRRAAGASSRGVGASWRARQQGCLAQQIRLARHRLLEMATQVGIRRIGVERRLGFANR